MQIRCQLEEVELNVEIDYEPAQDGGLTDPSWSSSFSIDNVKTLGGNSIISILSDEQMQSLNQQIQDLLDAEAKEAAESKYPEED